MVYIDLPPQQPVIELAQVATQPQSEQAVAEQASTEQALGKLISGVTHQAPEDILDRLLAPAGVEQVRRAADGPMFTRPQAVLTSPLLAQSSLPNDAEPTEAPESTEAAEAETGLPRLEDSPNPTDLNTLEDSPTEAGSPTEEILIDDSASENVFSPNPDASEPGNDDRAEETAGETAGETSEPSSGDRDSIEIEVAPNGETTTEDFVSQLQLTSDFQEFDPDTQIITARGNVVLKLNDAIIEANELWLNLVNRYALATGDVLLTRGSQIVRGSRAEYNFIQQAGVIRGAVGTLYLPQIDEDFGSPLEPLASNSRRAYDPINRRPDFQVSSDGSVQITSSAQTRLTGVDNTDGDIRQLRFETDELAFDIEGWRAQTVRITNDPFSPPELELRTDSLLLRNISPTQDELLLKRPRLVFDQGFSLPLLRSRILLQRGTVNPDDLNPIPVSVGIDGRDRGGLYVGRKLPLINNGRSRLTVTPQYFVARAFSGDSSSPIASQNFGLTADFNTALAPRTTLRGSADVTSLDLSEFTENLRTNIGIDQRIGDHRLALQYSYRERLFNGSLGFQDVQSSLGAVLLSPDIRLNDKGLRLTYQAGAQLINAETDRQDLLLASGSDTGRVTLGRYQASAALRQGINLWRGTPKPATQEEGLRFTPSPVVPFLSLNAGLRATGTYYSSDDFQNDLIGDINLVGQFGHLARNFGDYTRFRIGYARSFLGEESSPFLFDRTVDRNVLSLGLTQQIYGPFIAGFQTSINLASDDDINTIYTVEYSRRTYGVLLRYDASQGSGSIGFRLSNFSWIGDSNPFDTPRLRQVQGGVLEQ